MDGHTKSVTSALETHQETNIRQNNAQDEVVNEEKISLSCFVVQLAMTCGSSHQSFTFVLKQAKSQQVTDSN